MTQQVEFEEWEAAHRLAGEPDLMTQEEFAAEKADREAAIKISNDPRGRPVTRSR